MELVGLEGLPDVFECINSSDRKHWQPVGGNFGSIDLNFGVVLE